MARYIDADELIKKIFPYDVIDKKRYAINAEAVYKAIQIVTAADVVEVVRCKNCEHACFQYNNDKYPFGVYACKKQPSGRAYKKVRGDFFCSYGERKGE